MDGAQDEGVAQNDDEIIVDPQNEDADTPMIQEDVDDAEGNNTPPIGIMASHVAEKHKVQLSQDSILGV